MLLVIWLIVIRFLVGCGFGRFALADFGAGIWWVWWVWVLCVLSYVWPLWRFGGLGGRCVSRFGLRVFPGCTYLVYSAFGCFAVFVCDFMDVIIRYFASFCGFLI